MAAEIALIKQSMAYLSVQSKELQDQLHQDNSMNIKLNDFLKTYPRPAASAGAVVHEEQ